MIHKLKETDKYRSFLQDDTGDVIIQANPNGVLIGMENGGTFFDERGYYEVIVRGKDNPRYEHDTITAHVKHKRMVALYLKTGYMGLPTDTYDIDILSEADYDGTLCDHAHALIREFEER